MTVREIMYDFLLLFHKTVSVCCIARLGLYTPCFKKGYHPTTNDNFNNSCPISVIFGTYIPE